MIVDRMTKMRHYISCLAENEETSAEETAKMLIDNVWKLHKLSETIVSDRESQFVSLVWKTLCKSLRIQTKLFIAFHSETDHQSEIANQKMKRHLKTYCNYQQNDWSEWLSMTKFVSNAAISASTDLLSFMINYGFESRMKFDLIECTGTTRERVAKRKTESIIETMQKTWDFVRRKLAKAQYDQKHQADKKRSSSSKYRVGDLVWLFIKNIQTFRLFKKLNHKWIESYEIKKVLSVACELVLSSFMKIHSTFHTFLLRSAANDLLSEQIISSSSSVIIDESDEEEWKLDDILNS